MHHLTEDVKELLSEARVRLPLLSHHRHDCGEDSGLPKGSAREKICSAYREQGCNSIDTLNLGRKSGRQTGPVLWHDKFRNVS